MFLAETDAKLLDDGTLRFRLPEFPRTHYLISPWRRGFETVHVRGNRSR